MREVSSCEPRQMEPLRRSLLPSPSSKGGGHRGSEQESCLVNDLMAYVGSNDSNLVGSVPPKVLPCYDGIFVQRGSKLGEIKMDPEGFV
jgi:hypothetical protein